MSPYDVAGEAFAGVEFLPLARRRRQRTRAPLERLPAQLKWWVHQKWLEELYGMRNKVAHGRRSEGEGGH